MSAVAGVILLVGRIVFSALFLVSAMGHIRQGQMMIGYARSKGFPLASLSGWPSGVYLIIASLSIILGVWPDIGAILIGLWTIPTALYFHNYWTVKDPMQRQSEQLNFLRNITLLGAAISLFALFVAAGNELRFTLIPPLIHF